MLGEAKGTSITATEAMRRTREGPRFERSGVVQGLSRAKLRERCSFQKASLLMVLRCGYQPV